MKRRTRRIISAFLALVMVFLMVPPIEITVSAAESTTKTMTPLQEYRANTMNSLEKITSYINEREAEDAKLKGSFKTKIGKVNTCAKGVGTAINVLLNVGSSIDTDASWKENVKNIGLTALNIVCAYYGVQLPLPGESETEIIAGKIDELSEEMHERFNEVSKKLDDLADKVETNSASLAKYIYYANKTDKVAQLLEEFTQRNDTSAFNYYEDLDELINAYNSLMEEYLDGSCDTAIDIYDETIKTKYDNLYKAAKDFDALYRYIVIDEEEGFAYAYQKTIQDAMYEYAIYSNFLCSNSEIKDKDGNILKADGSIEVKCIEFAQDLYDTFLFSQYALLLCYNYQTEYITNKTYTDGRDVLDHFYYVNQSEYNVYGADIFADSELGIIKQMLEKQGKVKSELAEYIVHVTNLEGSYLYENGLSVEDNIVYRVPYMEIFETASHNTEEYKTTYGDFFSTNHVRVNNKVSQGDTLYMSMLPDELASLFADGEFVFVSNNPAAAVDQAGVVRVIGAVGDSFTISLRYCTGNDCECSTCKHYDNRNCTKNSCACCCNYTDLYTMDFQIADRLYSGGMGTEDCPYLISTWDDVASLASNSGHYDAENIHFKLTNDIDGNGKEINGIPRFRGVLDGNGFRIYNFKSSSSFIGTVEATATIKNLTLGHYEKSYTNYDGRSAYIGAYLNCDGTLYVGGLCGTNNGQILNCSLESVKVFGEIYWAGDNNIYSVVGGIAAVNYNIIDGGYVVDSLIQAKATTKEDTDPSACWAYSGGIIGDNYGELKNYISYNNLMDSYTWSYDKGGSSGYASSHCGAVVGNMRDNSTLDTCFERDNAFAGGAYDDDDGGYYTTGGLYGYRAHAGFGWAIVYFGTVKDSVANSLGNWGIDSATGCPVKGQREIATQEFNGHEYALIEESLAWEDARTVCEVLGGHLVTITSEEENAIVSTLLVPDSVFIGASDIETEGTWAWVTGEVFWANGQALAYTNWYPDEPNNSGGDQDYGAVFGTSDSAKTGKWDDDNATSHYYICEWDKVRSDGADKPITKETVYDYVYGSAKDTGGVKEEERYIRGETNLKYYNADGSIEKFDRFEGRIDTSDVSEDGKMITAIHLKSIPNTSMYKKVEVPVIVDFEEAKELCIYTKPTVDSYHINSTKFDSTGLNLVVLYDNGTTRFLNEGDYEISFDFTTVNPKLPIKFSATVDGQTLENTKYEVVVTDHEWDNGEVTTNPTHTTKGEKTYTCTGENCSATRTEPIDKDPEHKYSDNWIKYSDTQHVRECTCGEKEYANHIWNSGEETEPATHLKEGTRTYTCTACSTTKTESINKLVDHSFGTWTKYSDTQHVRACTCGEKEYVNHTWDNGVITEPATHLKEGTRTYTCTACSATKSEIIPKVDVLGTAPQIKISKKMARTGETVKLDITMKNVTALKSILLDQFDYDKTKLELVGFEWKLSGAALSDWDAAEEVATIAFNQNIDANGVIAELTFKVLEDTEVGNISISCTIAANEKLTAGGEAAVTIYVVDGCVTVTMIMRGDVNGDDFLDSDDAIYLLRSTLNPNRYPSNQDGDMNGDGFVDSDDAIYLLRHTLSPNRYPLS